MNDWTNQFIPNAGVLDDGTRTGSVRWLPLCREILNIMEMGASYMTPEPKAHSTKARWDEAKGRALGNERHKEYAAALSRGFEVRLAEDGRMADVEDVLLSTLKRLSLQNPLCSFKQFGTSDGATKMLCSLKLRQSTVGHKISLTPTDTEDGFWLRVEQDHEWRI